MSSIVLNVHVGTPKRMTQRAQIILQDHGGHPRIRHESHHRIPSLGRMGRPAGEENMTRATNNALLGAFVNRFLYEITADTPEPAQETCTYGGVDGENDYPSFEYADRNLGESFGRLCSLPDQYRFHPEDGWISLLEH